MQHHAQAVDLRLDDETGLFHPVIQLADALVPGARILGAEGIRQAEDRVRVADLLEFFRRHRPGALGGRIGRDPVRVVGFDLAQFDQQPVIFRVADDGSIQHMIAVVVEVDLLFEFFVTLLEGLIVHISHL